MSMKQHNLINSFTQNPSHLQHLAHALPLSESNLEWALKKVGVIPSKENWRQWLSLLFLAIGTGLFLAGVIFFFAYNWDALHRFERFAIIGGGVFLSAAAAFFLGVSKLPGKLLLMVASVLTGVLLATFGMVYQTGADSYQLFMTWALLIIPWVVISRFQPLWLVAILIANLAILLWEPTTRQSLFFRFSQVNWLLVAMLMALNFKVLVIREYSTLIHQELEQGRWFPRLVAAWVIIVASIAPLYAVTEGRIFNEIFGLVMLGVSITLLSALAYFYLFKRHDLLVVAMLLASLVFISTAALFNSLDIGFRDEGKLLIVGLYVVVAVTLSTKALMRIARRWAKGETA